MSISKGIAIRESAKIRAGAWPNILCTMALIAIGCTPYLGYNVSNAAKLVLFLLWVLSTFLFHSFKGKEKGFRIVVYFAIYLTLQILYSILGISRELVYFLARCQIYDIPVAMVYIISYYNTKEIKLLWRFSMVVFGINLIDNIRIGLTGGEYAFRVTEDTVNTNAGSTAFVVGCMLLIPILWVVFRKCHEKIIKVLSVLFISACAYYILLLNTRATALIILIVITLGFIMIELNKDNNLSRGKLVFRMLIIGIVAIILIGPLLSLFADAFSENVRMMSRIEDLAFVADSGDTGDLEEGSLYTRSILWMASINTFVSSVPHFLFGVGESVFETDVYSLLAKGVGNHSEFFDMAARYGVIGIIIYYFIIKNSVSFFSSLTNDKKIRNFMFVYFIGIMLFGIVNNLSKGVSVFIVIYLIFPVTIELLNRKAI